MSGSVNFILMVEKIEFESDLEILKGEDDEFLLKFENFVLE